MALERSFKTINTAVSQCFPQYPPYRQPLCKLEYKICCSSPFLLCLFHSICHSQDDLFLVTDAKVTVVSCGLAAILTSYVTERFSDYSEHIKSLSRWPPYLRKTMLMCRPSYNRKIITFGGSTKLTVLFVFVLKVNISHVFL